MRYRGWRNVQIAFLQNWVVADRVERWRLAEVSSFRLADVRFRQAMDIVLRSPRSR